MIKEITNFYDNNIVLEDIINIVKSRNYWNRFKNKKLLITGCYGSIARYIVYVLLYLNDHFDYRTQIYLNGRNKEKMDYYYSFLKNNKFVHFVIEDFNLEFNAIKDIEFNYIIHAASNARPDLFYNNPVDTFLSNVIATNNLLINNKKCDSFLYISTASVYGEIESNEINEKDFGLVNFLERSACYSEGKRSGECLCMQYYYQYNTPIKIARIEHTYGPTININSDTRSFSEFIKNAVLNEKIVLKSKGEVKRSFLYVSDNVLGLFDILLLGLNGNVYNVCANNNFIAIKDLAIIISKKYDIDVIFDIDINRPVNNYANRKCIVTNKKLALLGWNEKIDIESGFVRTINAFKI